MECGYELLDTAQAREWYDEVGVGQALRSYEKESRKQAKRPVFITTKLDPRLNGYESALTGALLTPPPPPPPCSFVPTYF